MNILFVWILFGLVNIAWLFKEEMDTHGHVTVSDFAIGFVLFLFGPIVTVIYSIACLVHWFEHNGDKVVFQKQKIDLDDDG